MRLFVLPMDDLQNRRITAGNIFCRIAGKYPVATGLLGFVEIVVSAFDDAATVFVEFVTGQAERRGDMAE